MLLMTYATQSFMTYETLIVPSKLLCWAPVQGKLTTSALKAVRPLRSAEAASLCGRAKRFITSAGLDADGRVLYIARASQRDMTLTLSLELEIEDYFDFDSFTLNSPPGREQEKSDKAFGVVRIGDFRQYEHSLVLDSKSLMI